MNWYEQGMSKTDIRSLFLGIIAVLTAVSLTSCNSAFAITSDQFQSQSLTGDQLKNNPLVAKILSEIEYSKQQVAQLEKNQKDKETNDKLIAQQRLIAKQLEDQALQILQTQTAVNSSKNAFDRFVAEVPDNSTKKVFYDEFNFMTKRVDAGHAAMKQVLANGGTWEEAMTVFSQYAAIKRVEMIELNKNLNIKYGLANSTIQAQFNQNGLLPDDYIKVPTQVLSHVST